MSSHMGGGDNSNRVNKRKMQDSGGEYEDRGGHKRSSYQNGSTGGGGGGGQPGDVYVKLLIPSALAGTIIGRGGERISQLQKDADVRVKMSKSNEFYPSTNERICLVIGAMKSVLHAHDIILDRMQEKADALRASHELEHHLSPERLGQIKLLIPKNTAGLIIGRAGSMIKQIKDESGAFVQISSKDTDAPERVLIVEGEPKKRARAFEMIVQKMSEDPLHSSVPNLSYALDSMGGGGGGGGGHVGGPTSHTPDPMAASSSNGAAMMMGGPSGGGAGSSMMLNQSNKIPDFNAAAYFLAGVNNLALLIINCGGSFQMTPEALKNALRNNGFDSSATIDIIDAITVLMNYGLITKIPPATILSSNPALSSFVNMSFGGGGVAGAGNFSNLISLLSASMTGCLQLQSSMSSSQVSSVSAGGQIASNGNMPPMMGGGGGVGVGNNPIGGYVDQQLYDNGGISNNPQNMMPPSHHHHHHHHPHHQQQQQQPYPSRKY